MFSQSCLPSYQRTIPSNETSLQPSEIERLEFRIHTPNPYLSDLNKDFCLMIDEVHQLNPSQPPLKWAVYGSFNPDAPIYNIQFYTFDPLTNERKDLIASVEWKMVGSPKEIHFKDGLITFPLLSFRGNRLGQFILKKDPFSMKEEVLVGHFGGYQEFEDTVRRRGIGEYHFSADHLHTGLKTPSTGDTASYSVWIDLIQRSHTDCEGRVKMCSIPHPPGTLPIQSPLLPPLLVWLVLGALERDRDNLLMYKTSAGFVTAPLTGTPRAQ